jgi:hypothetical protein
MERKWKIQQMERHVETGVVTTVFWRYELTDGDYTVGYGEPLQLVNNHTDVDVENGFIPFDELNEESVMQWVIDSLGEGYINHMDENLMVDVNNHRKQIESFSYGLPWEIEVVGEHPDVE